MKAAIYCRLSDEDHNKLSEWDDSVSIQNQKAMLIQHASNNGWTIHDIYCDDDYAGTDRRRPAFNRLIADAKAGKFDIVLCKSQSRFTRELELVETYINGLFPKLGIRFVSLVDSADTDDKGNRKTRQINGLVNEWFLEELSDNIKAVLTSRREQGYHIGSFAPYGYLKDPDRKGHLIIDPEAATIIREIYSLFLAGNGKQGIARILNERGIPNPTQYKRLHGMERNKHSQSSPLWSYFTIATILTNEVYIGNMIQGKTGTESYKTHRKAAYPQEQWIAVKGTHEPIIDQKTWEQVQSLIAKKATPCQKEPEGIFARKIRCFHCGFRMHSVKSGNKRGFKCERHALSHDACVGAYISLSMLERIVAAQLYALSEELLDEEQLEQGIDPFSEKRKMKTQMEVQTHLLQRRIEEDHTAMRAMYIDKVKGRITEAEYSHLMIKLGDEITGFEHQIAELTERNAAIGTTLTKYDNKKQIMQQYVGKRKLTKEMVSILIDYILVGKRNPITKDTPVEIHWNF